MLGVSFEGLEDKTMELFKEIESRKGGNMRDGEQKSKKRKQIRYGGI